MIKKIIKNLTPPILYKLLSFVLHNTINSKNILFDDYTDRKYYHYVENFIKPIKRHKRQSLFIVPKKNKLNIAEIKKSITHFRCVFD